MQYEVIEKFEPGEGKPRTVPPGSPIRVKLIPENTPPKDMLIALVQSAYELGHYEGLGWHRSQEVDSISPKEAQKYLLYGKKRTIWERVLRKPDNRIPRGVNVRHIRVRVANLIIKKTCENPLLYEMDSFPFVRDVASLDDLFRLAQKKVD